MSRYRSAYAISMAANIPIFKSFVLTLVLILLAAAASAVEDPWPSLDQVEARINAFTPNPGYPDDPYALITLKEGLASLRANAGGGIGAILVDEKTGKVIEKGRNRQFSPYFRSDMHAEMDLLTRYEDRMKKKGGWKSDVDPRKNDGLVLYSSMEPCPMCLIRIINSGIKKMYYVGSDPEGGMVHRMEDLPPFWYGLTRDREYVPARCSPELRKLAGELFHFSLRKMPPKN